MEKLFNEVWKPIKGYEGLYEVSNKGNVRSVDEKEMNELLNDEYYVREHLLPKSFEISESKLEFSFDMSDIHWFNDFESSVEWEKGDDFDSDKLEKALEDEIYKGIRCEYNGFSFTVKF